ncbi:C25 family cysteine peptidase [Candidatus Zixiibacteriota bacterium]
MVERDWGTHQKATSIAPALVVILLLVTFAGSVSAQSLTMEYSFAYPEIREVTLDGKDYHRVTMPEAPNSGEVGKPSLPARGTKILLPFGAQVTKIEVVPGQRVLLGDGYLVEPVTQPVPLSRDHALPAPLARDESIYASSNPFPGAAFVEIGTQKFRGYQVLVLRLQPVQYVPVSGELYYFPQLIVEVSVSQTSESEPLFRGLSGDEAEIRTKVDNTVLVDTYPLTAQRTTGDCDLLILTDPSFVEAWQPLKAYHDATGMLTEIRTLADAGGDTPEDIRDYIRERYLNDGIEYVIIGGDDEVIPVRFFYCQVAESPPFCTIPSDLYYGCLDGTFNYDGDDLWGEPGDGVGGGEVDLLAEVYVGRAAVDDTAEVRRFVEKTIQYAVSDLPYLADVLSCGEELGFGGEWEYAAGALELMIDSSSVNGYTTTGIPSDLYNIDRLYDRDWPDNDWPRAEFVSRVNDNVHFINHLGHGNPTQAIKMHINDILTELTNDRHCFIYSQSCLAGAFDSVGVDPDPTYNCWAECMNVKTAGGAFALVMNSRYGWGPSPYSLYTLDAPSQRFNREFWDAVFNPNESKPELGRANQDSKEDNLADIDNRYIRYCYYELNLFGDPTIRLKTPESLVFDYPQGCPEYIFPGISTTIPVTITCASGGILVPGSGQVHYAINGGAFITLPMTEHSPGHYEAKLPGAECGDRVEYYFSAEGAIKGIIYDPPPTSPQLAITTSEVQVIFTDDFETYQGWTVSGDAEQGRWERAIPDPIVSFCDAVNEDYDGSGKCYVTGYRPEYCWDVNYGTTTLISPLFDLATGYAVISYARAYLNAVLAQTPEDVFEVFISNDNGATWTAVETLGPVEQASGGWYEHSFWVSDFVEPTSQVRMRFDASDLNVWSNVEAALDAFQVTFYSCYPCDCPNFGDLNLDGELDPLDATYIVNWVYRGLDARIPIPTCPAENGDWDCNWSVDPVDVAFYVNYIYKAVGDGPCNRCAE